MDVVVAVLGGVVGLAIVTAFYLSNQATGRARRGALADLDGQFVILGLSRGKGLIVEEEGFLQLDDGAASLEVGERVISVPLGQIRWIADPRTGDSCCRAVVAARCEEVTSSAVVHRSRGWARQAKTPTLSDTAG